MDENKILDSENIDKEIEKLKNEKFTGINYWKILLLEWIENYNENNEPMNVTMEQVEKVADNLMNNDRMWNVIDEEIDNEMFDLA